jgi:hypothetical protein
MTFARVRALILVGVLFVGATVAVVLTLTRDTQSKPVVVNLCPPGAVPANRKLPERRDVKLNVYNGTKQVGLASKIGTELKNRDFDVKKMRNAPRNQIYKGVATIKFGPKTVGAAQEMNAYFLGVAIMTFDIERKDDVVDIFLGADFQQLATTTEVNQSIAALGEPVLPPGTCDIEEP